MILGGLKLIQGRMEMTKTQKRVLFIVAIIIALIVMGRIEGRDWGFVFFSLSLVVWVAFYLLWARRLIETAILDYLAKRGYVLSGKNHYYLGMLLFGLWIGSLIAILRVIYLLRIM